MEEVDLHPGDGATPAASFELGLESAPVVLRKPRPTRLSVVGSSHVKMDLICR